MDILRHRSTAMVPSKEFLRYATQCKHMARSSRDRGIKDSWSSMAERWLRCAALAEANEAAARSRANDAHHRTPVASAAH